MNRLPLIAGFAGIVGLIGCAGSPSKPATPDQAAPAAAATPAAPAPAADATPAAPDPALLAAVNGAARTDKERARDAARHPAETLAFFGIKPDSRVVELWPGGGWYTAILGPYLRDKGQLTITTFAPKGDGENNRDANSILARIGKTPELAKVAHQEIAPPEKLVLGPDGSADVVVTFRNIHNWMSGHYDAQVFQAIANVLKHGGVLGVEEHRAARELTDKEIDDSGYVPEARVIKLAEAVGLKLEARSEINANPKDTKDHPNGVWSLPPGYAGKDVDRDKFTAIGESDRMTLRFRKP